MSDTVLKNCIRELREALEDDAQAPRYIATVHRRGYRFIAPLNQYVSRADHRLGDPHSPQPPSPV